MARLAGFGGFGFGLVGMKFKHVWTKFSLAGLFHRMFHVEHLPDRYRWNP
jgi:hypothetical protein